MAKVENKAGGTGKTRQAVAVMEEAARDLMAPVDYGDYGAAGFEDMGRDDFAIPFLHILQPTSPITMEREDARPGMILNTVSGDIYPSEKAKNAAGVTFVPCYRQHVFVEWKPRDEKGGGGGYVATHEVDAEVVLKAKAEQKFGEYKVNGNDLVETFYVYGIQVKPDGLFEPCVAAFVSTKIKPYKNWMTRLNMIRVPGPGGRPIQPPLFAHKCVLQTILEKRDAGQSFNFVIDFEGGNAVEARIDPKSDLFQEAANFYQLSKDGIAKPNYTAPAAQEAGAKPAGIDDEIPF